MRPVPLENVEIPRGFIKRVIVAPDGDLTNDLIRPVDALVGAWEGDGIPCFLIRMLLEEEDLKQIEAGQRHFWLRILGQGLPPFSMDMEKDDA